MGIFDELRRITGRKPRSKGLEGAVRLRAEVVRLYAEDRFPEAAEAARRLVAWQRDALGETHPDSLRGQLNLAHLCLKQGDAGAARVLAEQVVGHLRTSGRGHDPLLAESVSLLAQLRDDETEPGRITPPPTSESPEAHPVPPRVAGASQTALKVLDQVAAFVVVGSDVLGDCQQAARELRAAIDSGEAIAEAQRLARGDHPLAALATLVDRFDTLNDHQWADLHEAVSVAFGSPLARAASRGRIKVRTVLASAPM